MAVGVLEDAARAVLQKAGRNDQDIDWLIPHQANIRIMQGTAKEAEDAPGQAGRHRARAWQHLGRVHPAGTGPMLSSRVRSNRVTTVMLEGVGGGFTWGAVLVDF